MNNNETLILVFTTNQEYQLNIIEALLDENNIHYHTIDKQDSMYKIGSFELYVDQKDMEKAKEIINKAAL
ncbi:MAG: DUF2007 domain-containing protein [Bacteroidales bacterium]|jgi:type III secretory pathway lipoprotein EscJ